jgi:hypothetical protein
MLQEWQSIIEVSNSNNSKPPQLNGKKGDNYIIWKMKLEADQVKDCTKHSTNPILNKNSLVTIRQSWI